MIEIAELADRAGVARRYTDVWGQEHVVADATLAACLEALGLPAHDPVQARALLDAEAAQPAVQVVPADRPFAVAGRWSVRLEDGGRLEGDDGVPGLSAGYHWLHDSAGERLILAAPDQALRPDRRRWGFAIQLYGLRSARNWGIGDFADLAEFGRLTAPLGADAVGVSPLHELFPHAPERISPYSPSSRRFLNTAYLSIDAIAGFDTEPVRAVVGEPWFQSQLAAARAADLVDYPAVAALKGAALRALYPLSRDDPDFARFRRAKGRALENLALHQALAEDYGVNPAVWPQSFRRRPEAAPADLGDRVGFFAWCQWHADRQLRAAQQACRSAGMAIGLYLDLAVGVSPDSAECWAEPDSFARGISVGAPPDAYNPNGQRWGLPPLNPRSLGRNGLQPFVGTMRAAAASAGALRIDHAFGLDRLYWIPEQASPRDGTYVRYPRDALTAVLRIESRRHGCLIIGEDLGTMPPGFHTAMAESGLLSTRVLYFEQDGSGFKPPEAYPELALAMVSTHDLPTLAGWWRGSDIELRQSLGLYPEAGMAGRDEAQRAADRERLRHALAAAGLDPAGEPPGLAVHRFLARTSAALVVAQVEDALGLEDQTNLPGTIDQHPNWRRRLPVPLESLGPALAATAAALAADRPR